MSSEPKNPRDPGSRSDAQSDARSDAPSDLPRASRRQWFKTLAAIPVTVSGLGLPSIAAAQRTSPQSTTEGLAPVPPAPPRDAPRNYAPSFFNADEWAFVRAACDRLIPDDDMGPGAVALGVPEFLDRHMQTPYAAGDIWYMEGPFLEASVHFGYQGRLPLRDLLRVGIHAMDAHSANQFGGKKFAALTAQQQDGLLKAAENGKLGFKDVPDKYFFGQLLAEVRNGYFADPSHGGNRDMGAWKAIAYPGVRADYLDWVGVRDRPYPIGPVDLAGRRG